MWAMKGKLFKPPLGLALLGLVLFAVRFSEGYNDKYPLTTPFKTRNMHTFRIAIIADLDSISKSPTEETTWISYLKKGYLRYLPGRDTIVVNWDRTDPITLKTNYAIKDRSMELSELVTYDGKLLAVDDRTGVVFEIVNTEAIPWVLLMDGNGRTTKGFKSEWATVKDRLLYVGSIGKEVITYEGEFVNNDPLYIKTITPEGVISHIDWKDQYLRLRAAIDIYWPGYMTHESGVWSEVHQKWFFLPRKCSTEKYNYTADAYLGCSYLLSADADINGIRAVQIPSVDGSRGFSSFKFIPTSGDTVIVALRSVEVGDKTATYITAFTIEGKVLLQDTLISDLKFEGIEFI
ncbi:hypothetical protein PPYR_09254 [Photinus pyralis]|uniref:Apyrase n=1 Tax=Photinus pyralis TaxID=7054 RepID=A0A5N4ALS2_PHOPY|nr:soluble calcium-activated nucleotidase 1-like [Photinus pyralis]KAB0798261.1 hypothetical protein PPYR_09254 [Photinus pyralis]